MRNVLATLCGAILCLIALVESSPKQQIEQAVEVIKKSNPPKFFYIERANEAAMEEPHRPAVTGPGSMPFDTPKEKQNDYVRKEGYEGDNKLVKYEVKSETLRVNVVSATIQPASGKAKTMYKFDFEIPRISASIVTYAGARATSPFPLYKGSVFYMVEEEGTAGERIIAYPNKPTLLETGPNRIEAKLPILEKGIFNEILTLIKSPNRKLVKPPRPTGFKLGIKEFETRPNEFPRECMALNDVAPNTPLCVFMEQYAFTAAVDESKVEVVKAANAKNLQEEAGKSLITEIQRRYLEEVGKEFPDGMKEGDIMSEEMKTKIAATINTEFAPKLEEAKAKRKIFYPEKIPTCKTPEERSEIDGMVKLALCQFDNVDLRDTLGEGLAVTLTRSVLNLCFRKTDKDNHNVPDVERVSQFLNKMFSDNGDTKRFKVLGEKTQQAYRAEITAILEGTTQVESIVKEQKETKDYKDRMALLRKGVITQMDEAAVDRICQASKRAKMSLWSTALYYGASRFGQALLKNLKNKPKEAKPVETKPKKEAEDPASDAAVLENPSRILATLTFGDRELLMGGMSPGK